MSGDILTMRETAAAVGLSYERFRKVWPAKVREEGMPMPFSGHHWDAEAIRAWRRDRSQRGAPTPKAPPDAGEPGPRRLARARAQLAELRGM